MELASGKHYRRCGRSRGRRSCSQGRRQPQPEPKGDSQSASYKLSGPVLRRCRPTSGGSFSETSVNCLASSSQPPTWVPRADFSIGNSSGKSLTPVLNSFHLEFTELFLFCYPNSAASRGSEVCRMNETVVLLTRLRPGSKPSPNTGTGDRRHFTVHSPVGQDSGLSEFSKGVRLSSGGASCCGGWIETGGSSMVSCNSRDLDTGCLRGHPLSTWSPTTQQTGLSVFPWCPASGSREQKL